MAIERDLAAPLDPRRVQSREGSGGKKLSYLTTHDVKRTANRIFGYDGWSYVVNDLISLGEEPFKNSRGREGVRVGYRATVTVSVDGVERGDVGYGDAMEYNGSRITPHELASKEAVSDALKRCLSSWGDQFGLVLYGEDPAPPEDLETAATEPPPAAKSPRSAPARNPGKAQQPAPPTPPAAGSAPSSGDSEKPKVASAEQVKRLWTIARKELKLTDESVASVVVGVTGQQSTRAIPVDLYDTVIESLQKLASS